MRKGEELKAPRHASVAATRDHVTTRDIFPTVIIREVMRTKKKGGPSLASLRKFL